MNDTLSLKTDALTGSRIDGELLSLQSLAGDGKKKMSEKQMRQISNQFEELVVRQLLKEMRKTVPNDGYIERSHATEMYMDMVDDNLSKQLADSSDFGIENMIYAELKEKNDHIGDPEKEKKPGSYLEINGHENSTVDKTFMPLAKDTDQFIELHNNRNRMMDLPQAKDPFMPLDRRRRVPTDRIENR